MPRYIGKPFKTPDGALKRARFENNHQPDHFLHKYVHVVVEVDGCWRVERRRALTALQPSTPTH